MKPTREPFYGCNNCYTDYTFRAEDLRVFEEELWCDECFNQIVRDDHSCVDLHWYDQGRFVPELDKPLTESSVKDVLVAVNSIKQGLQDLNVKVNSSHKRTHLIKSCSDLVDKLMKIK